MPRGGRAGMEPGRRGEQRRSGSRRRALSRAECPCHSFANPLRILCNSSANPLPILCQSSANPLSVLCWADGTTGRAKALAGEPGKGRGGGRSLSILDHPTDGTLPGQAVRTSFTAASVPTLPHPGLTFQPRNGQAKQANARRAHLALFRLVSSRLVHLVHLVLPVLSCASLMRPDSIGLCFAGSAWATAGCQNEEKRKKKEKKRNGVSSGHVVLSLGPRPGKGVICVPFFPPFPSFLSLTAL